MAKHNTSGAALAVTETPNSTKVNPTTITRKHIGYWDAGSGHEDIQRVITGEMTVTAAAKRHHTTRKAIHSAATRHRSRMGLIIRPELLDVAPFAEAAVRAVDEGRFTWSELARDMGWLNGGKGDCSHLKRRLGLMAYSPAGEHESRGRARPSRSRYYVTSVIPHDVACVLVRTLGCDPVDFDL
jgi:hypothetical protein